MAPEHKAQQRAYDHESGEPQRRRRPAADWGVGEDIFDRMPSRRFARADRRPTHHDEPTGEAKRARAAEEWAASWDDAPAREERRGESMTIVIGRDESAPAARRIVVETDDFTALTPAQKTETGEFAPVPPRGDTDEFVGVEAVVTQYTGLEDPLGRDFADAPPNGRRTIKISGHPDRLPVPRTQRPPRTAVERLGTSPDRIAAYAVALGFLLVLIAVLTTGQ